MRAFAIAVLVALLTGFAVSAATFAGEILPGGSRTVSVPVGYIPPEGAVVSE